MEAWLTLSQSISSAIRFDSHSQPPLVPVSPNSSSTAVAAVPMFIVRITSPWRFQLSLCRCIRILNGYVNAEGRMWL